MPPGIGPAAYEIQIIENRRLPAAATAATTATAMPVDSLLAGGFGAEALEFANGFPGLDLGLHRFSSLKKVLVSRIEVTHGPSHLQVHPHLSSIWSLHFEVFPDRIPRFT